MKRALLVAIVAVGCSKPESAFKSNFASVRIAEVILDAKTNAPWTGTLVARDREIAAVAKHVLGATTFEQAAENDPTGLVVVIPVEKGVASGKAVVHVDLHAPILNPEVARRSDEALDVARMRGKSIKLAEATFIGGKLDGVATVFAPDPKTGKLVKAAEVQFRDHVIDGMAVEFYPGSSQRLREVTFEMGLENGVQKTYYADGKPRSVGAYVRGRPIGKHESWYPTGQREAEVIFGEDGSEQVTRWWSNGASRETPANGVIDDFYASGQLHSKTTYANGIREGAHTAWWKNGKLATEARYVGGQLEGDYKRFYANGKPWESARYERGTRVGPYRKWWKNGKPAHAYEYKNGKLDGEYKQFYDTGAKWAIALYQAGKPQGAIERWFPDGKLGYVMNHENGRPHGAHKRWWADGKPRLEATYVNGHLDGEFKNWLEDGTVYEIATYQRGVKIKTTRQQ